MMEISLIKEMRGGTMYDREKNKRLIQMAVIAMIRHKQ